MMIKFKQYIFLSFAAFLFASCEKIITLPVEDNESKVVIEGDITDQPGPYFVKLSRSINLNEPNKYPIISDGIVVISDNAGVKDTLKYLTAGIYRTKLIKGGYGKTYFLDVNVDGKHYTAQSTMPTKSKR